MAVHLVDQVVDQFGSIDGRLAANHLAVTHAQEGRGRRLGRKVVNGGRSPCIGHQAASKRRSARAEGTEQHDFSSSTELKIGLQSGKDLRSSDEFPRFS